MPQSIVKCQFLLHQLTKLHAKTNPGNLVAHPVYALDNSEGFPFNGSVVQEVGIGKCDSPSPGKQSESQRSNCRVAERGLD